MQWEPYHQNIMKHLKSSRAYDSNRDGFVIAGGGGTIVLEELNMQKQEVQKFMLKLLVMEQLQMVMIWFNHLEKALLDV